MSIYDTDFNTTNFSSLDFALLTPDPPTSVIASVADQDVVPYTVTVNWVRPSNIGTGTLSSYEVYRNGIIVATVDDLVLTYEDIAPELDGYTYTVTATSDNGTSVASAGSIIQLSRGKTGKKIVSFAETKHFESSLPITGNTKIHIPSQSLDVLATQIQTVSETIKYDYIIASDATLLIEAAWILPMRTVPYRTIGTTQLNVTEGLEIRGQKDYTKVIRKLEKALSENFT